MQYFRLIYVIPVVLCNLLCAVVSISCAENVFHWTDEAGVSCYSNVTPPVDVSDYSVAPVFSLEEHGETRKIEATETVKTLAANPDIIDISREFLLEKIQHRKISIQHVEVLLQKHPDNTFLRKSLFRKRQYLHEELNRLNTLN